MIRIFVDDLTEEQLDAIVEARRCAAPELTPIQRAIAEVLDTPPPPRKPEHRPEIRIRMCVRCGIDTAAPELCRDCADVLADEAAA
ncbi:hypothetical protein ACU61A_15825 [Pseudonocardia sichuanensis]